MSEKPENPRAFPLAVNDTGNAGYEGMALRDYFAAKAMQGFAADPTNHKLFDDMDDVACNAYAMADAMLRARQS